MLALKGENIIATPMISVIHRFCDLENTEYGIGASLSTSSGSLVAVMLSDSIEIDFSRIVSIVKT